MRTTIFTLFAAASVAAAAESADPKAPEKPAVAEDAQAKADLDSAARDAAVEQLFSEHENQEDFDNALAAAIKAGVSTQAMLEARFLYHVDNNKDDAVAAMLPDVLAAKDAFKPENSEIFATKEDWLAATEYVQAIDAMKKGDKPGFKQHITEAFWLSPSQGAAFAPHIERMRLDEAMKSVKFDFDAAFKPLAGGDGVKFSSVRGDRKAVLLHFWSPITMESQELLPAVVSAARDLESKGIAVASFVADDAALLKHAREAFKKLGDNPPGAWLIDNKEASLARALRAQTAPMFVLINAEGTVLHHGSFNDADLWKQLQKIAPDVKQPQLDEPAEPVGEGE